MRCGIGRNWADPESVSARLRAAGDSGFVPVYRLGVGVAGEAGRLVVDGNRAI